MNDGLWIQLEVDMNTIYKLESRSYINSNMTWIQNNTKAVSEIIALFTQSPQLM